MITSLRHAWASPARQVVKWVPLLPLGLAFAACDELSTDPLPALSLSVQGLANGSLRVGQAVDVQLVVRDQAGTTVQALESTWVSSDPGALAVVRAADASLAGDGARFAGLAPGEATISVEIDHPSLEGRVDVPVVITPAVWPDSLAAGESTEVAVDVPAGAEVTWESVDAAVVRVVSDGGATATLSGRARGSTQIVARVASTEFPDVVFRLPVRVTPVRIVIDEAWPDTLNATNSALVTVRLEGTLGAIPGLPVRWRSSNETVMQVTGVGLATSEPGAPISASLVGVTPGGAELILSLGGDGVEAVEFRHPVRVAQKWVSVGAGLEHTCAATVTGRAYCWGSDESGALGSGRRTSQSTTPTPVATVLRFDRVGAGGVPFGLGIGQSHSCGSVGRLVFCWGSFRSDQLGSGQGPCEDSMFTGICTQSLPVAFDPFGAASFTEFDVGGIHTCGGYLSPEPSALCSGTTAASPGVWYVSPRAGGYHACYSDLFSQALYCSGLNGRGQLGDGTTNDRAVLGNPVRPSDGRLFEVIRLDAGGEHTCALAFAEAPAQLHCWGSNSSGQLGVSAPDDCSGVPCSLYPLPLDPGIVVDEIRLGGEHSCVLSPLGEARCWGSNEYGQLGDGGTQDRPAPSGAADTELQFADFSAGWFHTCGIDADGSLYCWGRNNRGQLGTGDMVNRSMPVRVLEPISG